MALYSAPPMPRQKIGGPTQPRACKPTHGRQLASSRMRTIAQMAFACAPSGAYAFCDRGMQIPRKLAAALQGHAALPGGLRSRQWNCVFPQCAAVPARFDLIGHGSDWSAQATPCATFVRSFAYRDMCVSFSPESWRRVAFAQKHGQNASVRRDS